MEDKGFFSKRIIFQNEKDLDDIQVGGIELHKIGGESEEEKARKFVADMEKGDVKEIKPINLQLTDKSIIRYSNDIDISGIGGLTAVEHNIFNTILLAIVESNSTKVKVPLANFKRILKMHRKSNLEVAKYLNDVFMKFIVLLKHNTLNFAKENNQVDIISKVLITEYQVSCSDKDMYIFFRLIPGSEHLFHNMKQSFSQIMVTDVLAVKGKYSKALCHILARYFKGEVSLDIEEFRNIMGFTTNYKHSTMCRELNKAIAILINQGMYSYIKYDFVYGAGRGRPVVKIHLSFRKTIEYDGKLRGQVNLFDNEFTTIDDTFKEDIVKEDIDRSTNKENNKNKEVQDFSPLIGLRCECGGEMFYKKCKKQGSTYYGKYQLFCHNNGFYKTTYALTGNGTCEKTTYHTEEELEEIKNKIKRKQDRTYTKEEKNRIIKQSALAEKYKTYLFENDDKIKSLGTMSEDFPVEVILSEKRRFGLPEKGIIIE